MALQLLRIMEGLHSAKALHQDLQPGSLMRSEKRQLYLVGFGRAKSIPIRRHPRNCIPLLAIIVSPAYARATSRD